MVTRYIKPDGNEADKGRINATSWELYLKGLCLIREVMNDTRLTGHDEALKPYLKTHPEVGDNEILPRQRIINLIDKNNQLHQALTKTSQQQPPPIISRTAFLAFNKKLLEEVHDLQGIVTTALKHIVAKHTDGNLGEDKKLVEDLLASSGDLIAPSQAVRDISDAAQMRNPRVFTPERTRGR